MENDKYIVSARKYRPSTFDSVVGQKSLVNTLKNAISTKRLAQAYLFCGPRGVGKTSCARIFAKSINCLNPSPDGEACGECESCKAIEEGRSFNLMELDAASNNSVNDIRALTEQVGIPPQTGRYRVFIIDEVHMLSTGAFNAFLKTLEEPPSYVIFILATTEKHKVLPTILSRCQIYDFRRITPADMADHLAFVARSEGIEAEPQALDVIARKADGAMRDALSIFDQVAASSRGHVTYQSTIENLNILDYDYYFQLVEAFRAGDVAQALLLYAAIRGKGFDSLFFVNGLATHVRDLMLAASEATLPLLEQSEEVTQRYRQQAAQLPLEWHYAALRLLSDCDQAYRTATEKRLLIELTLIRLCQLMKPPTPPFDRVDSEAPLLQPVLPQAPQQVAYQAPQQPSQPAPKQAPQQPPTQSPAPAPKQAPPSAPPPSASTEGAPAPTKAEKPATARKRPKRGSISLKGQGEEHTNDGTPAAPSTPAGTTAATDRPFSDEDLAGAWSRFIAANPDKQVLIAAMRSVTPQRTDSGHLLITADHQASLHAYETNREPLANFLRQELHNNSIILEFLLDESKMAVQQLPPKEFLNDIITTNPILGQFLRDIDAQMA